MSRFPFREEVNARRRCEAREGKVLKNFQNRPLALFSGGNLQKRADRIRVELVVASRASLGGHDAFLFRFARRPGRRITPPGANGRCQNI